MQSFTSMISLSVTAGYFDGFLGKTVPLFPVRSGDNGVNSPRP